MADVEVMTSSDVAAPVPDAAPASQPELPSYDESLLIKVKGKVKKPVAPDTEERNLQVAKLQAEITKHSDRIKEIKAIIDEQRGASRNANSGRPDTLKRLQGLRNEFQTVLRQKQHIREELNDTSRQREAVRNELRSLREKLPRGSTFDQLEQRIQETEFKLAHESLSVSEEKRMQQQLQNLTAAQPMARQHAQLEARLAELEQARSNVSKRLSECDAVLNDIKAREEAERQALDEASAKAKETEVNVPALNVEKQECWEVICALREKINEIRKEFDDRYKEYIKLDKNYNAWMRHEKRKKYEERQREREEREAARQANEEAATGDTSTAEAYESEILTIDQLLTYLRKFSASEDDVSAAAEQKQVEVPQGMKLFKRKDEDMSFFNVASKKKQHPAKAAAPAKTDTKKKLNHSLETLKTFMMLGVDVPQTTAEILATIEKVVAKRAEYLELRKKGKEAPKPQANGSHASSSKAAAAHANGNHASAPQENGVEHDTEALDQDASAGAASTVAADGVGVTLTVDKVTQAVSLQLKV